MISTFQKKDLILSLKNITHNPEYMYQQRGLQNFFLNDCILRAFTLDTNSTTLFSFLFKDLQDPILHACTRTNGNMKGFNIVSHVSRWPFGAVFY